MHTTQSIQKRRLRAIILMELRLGLSHWLTRVVRSRLPAVSGITIAVLASAALGMCYVTGPPFWLELPGGPLPALS